MMLCSHACTREIQECAPAGALGFSDPRAATGSEEELLAVFRRVRDAIVARVEVFVGATNRVNRSKPDDTPSATADR